MLLFGKFGLLIVLLRTNVHFSHPKTYALIWGFYSMFVVVLKQLSLEMGALMVVANMVAIAAYFYILDYLDGSLWWWLVMMGGAYGILFWL